MAAVCACCAASIAFLAAAAACLAAFSGLTCSQWRADIASILRWQHEVKVYQR